MSKHFFKRFIDFWIAYLFSNPPYERKALLG